MVFLLTNDLVSPDGRVLIRKGAASPNGVFDTKTGDIYIDINAGDNNEGALLWTAAHEYTHFMRKYSPESFRKLADYLVKTYGESGYDVNKMIELQQQKAKDDGRTLSRDEAYEEMVADAMQTMFTDTDLISRLNELKQTDRTAWEKLRDFFKRIYDKITKAYEGLDAQSTEAAILRNMKDKMEEISGYFAEGLAEAGRNYQGKNESANEAQGLKFSIGNIVGKSGTEYGEGVHLDSVALDGLSEIERISTVKSYIKSLSGQVFSAVSPDGKQTQIIIAPSDKKYRKENGYRVFVSKDMLNFLNDKTKQEALVLVDELIETAKFVGQENAIHAHDWLDNNGKNKWDLWKTYLLNKNNTIWEASLCLLSLSRTWEIS